METNVGTPLSCPCGYTTLVRQTHPELEEDDKELKI